MFGKILLNKFVLTYMIYIYGIYMSDTCSLVQKIIKVLRVQIIHK